MRYTIHVYQDRSDLADMLALVRSRPAELILRFPGPADLRELLGIQAIREMTRLWRAEDGRMAGFALLNSADTYASLSIEWAGQMAGSGLGDAMLAWGEEAFRDCYHGQATGLGISAEECERERIALLERHGYIRQDEDSLTMERALDEPIPQPDPPAGFTIRTLRGEEEIPAWVTLHCAAFGTANMTEEYRRSMALSPDYDPDLDLVAAAPDGRLAAYVFGSISREENELTGMKIGYTDPVATHPEYQRLGLCRALLLACLRRLKDRGMTTARLGTGSWNTAMQQSAHSAGFQVCGRTRWYEKEMVGKSDSEQAS